MELVTSRLTVYFDDPFWVGVYEREAGGCLEAARVVFGPEPKDYEVYAFFLNHWSELRFSPPVGLEQDRRQARNPKRVRREIARALSQAGTGTKAQQAIKLQHELTVTERKNGSRDQKRQRDEEQYALRQQKKKQKHRGH